MAKLYKIGDKIHKVETQEDGTNSIAAILEIEEIIEIYGYAVMAILDINGNCEIYNSETNDYV